MRTIILEPGTRKQIGRSGDTGVTVQFRALPWHQEYPAGLPYLMVTSPGGARTPVTVTYSDGMISGEVPDELIVRPGLYTYEFAWVSAGEQVQSSPCGAIVLEGETSKRWNPHSTAPDWADRIFLAAESIEQRTDGVMEAATAAQEAMEGAVSAKDDAEDARDTAVDAKDTAVEVLESIPQEYTALSNDVGDLKSAVDLTPIRYTGNLMDNAELTNGHSVNPATGADVDVSTSWNTTNYIPVRPGQTYVQLNLSVNNFAFYGISKNFIDLRSNTNVCDDSKLRSSFTLPENVAYARFTVANTSIGIAFLCPSEIHPGLITIDDAIASVSKEAFSGLLAISAERHLYGDASIDPAMYEIGSINDSGYSTYEYGQRAISRFQEAYPYDVIITPASGTTIAMYQYSDDGSTPTFVPFSSDAITVAAGTKFRLMIRNATASSVKAICANVTMKARQGDLPGYYFNDGYIDQKISTIIDKSPIDGLQFVFITDVHVGANAGVSPNLIRYIRSKTNAVPFVVFGGDVLSATVPDNDDVLNEAKVWQSWIDRIGKDSVYQVQGNHDYLGFYYDGETRMTYNAPNGICRQFVTGNLGNSRVVCGPGKMYYYFDVPAADTRIIMLNDYDTTRNNGIFYGYMGTSNDQIFWLMEDALNITNKRVIFVSHQPYVRSLDQSMPETNPYAKLQTLMECIANGTTFSHGGRTKDFSNSGIKLVGHLCGHTHDDSSDLSNGVLTIVSVCDKMQGTRTSGTISEQAFDVVTVDYTNEKLYTTRIGAGSDREFDLT